MTGRLGDSFASGRHLDFVPRLAEGRYLAESRPGRRSHAISLQVENIGAALDSTLRLAAALVLIFAAGCVALAASPLLTGLVALGVTGLFLRHLNHHVPVVRYVVDASYWVYLVHLPFTLWIRYPGTSSAFQAGPKRMVFVTRAPSTSLLS